MTDLRLALHELAAEHRLDARAAGELHRLAGLHDEPAAVARTLPRAMLGVAAALGGLGVIFWVAANWGQLGRAGHFTLLQALVVAACVGALVWRAARAPLGLLALLAIGGLFAYFGQTYQTGADPWQLFALWAVLALPLAFGIRSDLVWAPWALVVLTAISLWVQAHTGHRWRVEPGDLQVHLIGWVAALLFAGALSAPLRRWTGAGIWSLRVLLTLTVVLITTTALGGLFHRVVAPHYGLGLVLFAAAAAAMATPRLFEIYGLSAVALGLNTLLVAGLARLMFQGGGGDFIGRLLVLGLVAAGLLSGTVTLLLRLSRRHGAEPAASQGDLR